MLPGLMKKYSSNYFISVLFCIRRVKRLLYSCFLQVSIQCSTMKHKDEICVTVLGSIVSVMFIIHRIIEGEWVMEGEDQYCGRTAPRHD